jgi:phosphotransferase system HPr (HPr) family protein
MNSGAVSKKFVIQNELGVHVRPASLFARTAGKFSSTVIVKKGEQVVDGKSIMQLLMLGALQGTEIVIEAEGEDADEALGALEEIIQNNFGE